MKKVLCLLALMSSLMNCQNKETDPIDALGSSSDRSVLTYTTNFPGTYQVTDFDASGIPTQAKVAINYPYGVIPTGTYTSSIKLEYDPLVRLKKTVQTFNELGYDSCCPGATPYTDPDRQLINEYEYQGNTTNITYEISYTVNAKKAQKAVVSEYVRTFTDRGLLTQEKRGTTILYQASYDHNDNPITETVFDNTGAPISRTWEYVYDANQHLLSRKIKGSQSVEINTYDQQGRLLRQVTNLPVLTPFKPDNTVGRLVDYRFARLAQRSEMMFTYFTPTQQWTHDMPRVLTYTYTNEQILITNTAYQFWADVPDVFQAGFDFETVPQQQLASITVTTWQLNKWNKLAQEASTQVYVSDKLAPEQRNPYYASDHSYTYDERGNLVSSSGHCTSFIDKTSTACGDVLTARYKSVQ